MTMRDNINAVTRTKVYKAPTETPEHLPRSIFLAGSIDQGKAENWQDRVTAALFSEFPNGLAIFNPRRDSWDKNLVQDISNPPFAEQVRWELNHLNKADLICFYFDPNGQAPITLMELGLHAKDGNAVVCCPEGYWRRGNVQMVCDEYDLPLFDNIDEFIDCLKEKLK